MSKNTKNVRADKTSLLSLIVLVAFVLGAVAIVDIQTSDAAITKNVEVGQTQKVLWTANNIHSPTVSVSLIKKVSDNPATYTLVRTISSATPNDGLATWVPATSDIGNGLSLEIGCTPSTHACAALDKHTSELAVVASPRFANTAAAFQAIEAQGNR